MQKKSFSNTVEPFVTKYGPLTIHQNGKMVTSLQATPTSGVNSAGRVAHSLDNVRLSLHLERFDSQAPFSADMTCIIRFPEYGYELKHAAPCQMRAGHAHGSAVVQPTSICVDFEDAHDTQMEVEYLTDEQSLDKQSVNIKFPSQVACEQSSAEDSI